MNYVAYHTGNGEIYAVANCSTLEENKKLLDYAEEHGIRATTGRIHTSDEMIHHAQMVPHSLWRGVRWEAHKS